MPRTNLDPKLRAAVLERDGGKCRGIEGYECPLKGRENDPCGFHIDHRLPVADGGTDELDNLQLLCPCCHQVKTRQDNDNRNTLAAERRRTESLRKELRELGMRDKIERERAEQERLLEQLNMIKTSKDPSQAIRYLEGEERDTEPVRMYIRECIERCEDYDPNAERIILSTLQLHFYRWKQIRGIRTGNMLNLRAQLTEMFGRLPKGGWTNFKLKDPD